MDTNNIHHKALPIGTILDGKYEVLSILGSGSFGITYLALFGKLDSKVVIKEYFPSELAHRDITSTVIPTSSQMGEYYTKGKERFLFEAKTITKFKHPYIVRVIDYFETNNTAYFVMDYEEGETLSDWIRKQDFIGEERILPIIVPILEALSEIHSQHIYHRDIKPDNIYIRANEVPMLIDFGAAKESYQDGSKASSMNAQTAGYAAPEQKSSIAKYIGDHTDIYAIGAVLYRIVTGNAPPTADDRSISRDNEDKDCYIPLANQSIRGYSKEFLANIDWALSFLSKNRPKSAKEFQRALMMMGIKKEKIEKLTNFKKKEKINNTFFIIIILLIISASIIISSFKSEFQGYTIINGRIWQDEEYTKLEKQSYLDNKEYGKVLKWENAKNYCQTLSLGGYTNWSLPLKDEWAKLNIEKPKLRNPINYLFWSSEIKDTNQALVLDFSNGNFNWYDNNDSYYVRCIQ